MYEILDFIIFQILVKLLQGTDRHMKVKGL